VPLTAHKDRIEHLHGIYTKAVFAQVHGVVFAHRNSIEAIQIEPGGAALCFVAPEMAVAKGSAVGDLLFIV